MSRHELGAAAVAARNGTRLRIPTTAGRWDRTNFLNIVLPRDLRELHRVAENAIQSTVYGIRALQRAEGGVNLRAACSQKLRELTLRKTEFQCYALSDRR